MMQRRKFAALLAVGLMAAACGGDDESTTEDPGTTDPTTGETTDDGTSEDPAMDDRADWPESVTFGFVPSREAETLQDNVKPFEDLLTAELGIEVNAVVTSEYAGLVEAMGNGQADFGAFGPTGYVLAEQRYDIEPLIQSIRFGAATFHGQFFTNDPSVCAEEPAPGAWENTDSGPVLVGPTDTVALQVGYNPDGTRETLEDGTEVDEGLACEPAQPLAELVVGEDFAFGSQTSTSGFIFPALELLNAGADWESDFNAIFTGGHDEAVTAVYNGDAKFGVSFDDARRNIRRTNPDVGSKVIVIGLTPEVPNDVVAVRSDLPDSLKEAVYTAIEEYLATEEGQAVFDEIYGWTDIRRADDAEFDIVREAVSKISGIEN